MKAGTNNAVLFLTRVLIFHWAEVCQWCWGQTFKKNIYVTHKIGTDVMDEKDTIIMIISTGLPARLNHVQPKKYHGGQIYFFIYTRDAGGWGRKMTPIQRIKTPTVRNVLLFTILFLQRQPRNTKMFNPLKGTVSKPENLDFVKPLDCLSLGGLRLVRGYSYTGFPKKRSGCHTLYVRYLITFTGWFSARARWENILQLWSSTDLNVNWAKSREERVWGLQHIT